MSGHELAMALRTAYLAMHRRTNALSLTAGVTADQFVVLAALAHEHAMTQRDLAERTSSDPNTLRAMVVLLERQGLIERRSHPTDRRARTVVLTANGRRIFRRLWQRSESLRSELAEVFTKSETVQLVKLLQRLSESISTPQPSLPQRRRPSLPTSAN